MVKMPDAVSDEQAILLSDIFPTGFFGAELAAIHAGKTVAIFGCGPVGQFAIASAKLLNAGRVFAIDCVPSRLDMARNQGAEVIDFSKEDPVGLLKELTGGIGVDRVIDAVGVDAAAPHSGPAAAAIKEHQQEFQQELSQVAPQRKESEWQPGDAPSLALMWGVESLDKAGTMAIIGVYPQTVQHFPIGLAMNKNLTLRMGNCNHRTYIPQLVNYVRSGIVNPAEILTQREPLSSAIDAYKTFDQRQPGWMKVELTTAGRA
jgi:threonine dehydrogenase-like Zn-dependent dehydrogenase